MISKPILKLIDEAIIPALIILFSKILSVLSLCYFLKIDFEVSTRGLLNIFPTINYPNTTDYIKIENYSNLIMFIIIASGTLFIILKAHFLHSSHIKPSIHQKLAKFNLEKMVSSSYHIYHQAIIWLVFLWLTTAFLAISYIENNTYPQIFFLAVFITINFTWIFSLDVQKEINLTDK